MSEQEIVLAGTPKGRPSSYTISIANEICDRLALGESLRGICRDDHMPHPITVYRWIREHDDFRNHYAIAREDQGYTSADEIIELRRQLLLGEITHNQARVAIDSLKWEASKRVPKVFGDKLDLTSSDRSMSPAGLSALYGDDEDSDKNQGE